MELDNEQAMGRVIAAGRMFAGWDQGELAEKAGVSSSTVSNIERGRIVPRPETLKSLRRALRKKGVTLTFDPANGHIAAAIRFELPED